MSARFRRGDASSARRRSGVATIAHSGSAASGTGAASSNATTGSKRPRASSRLSAARTLGPATPTSSPSCSTLSGSASSELLSRRRSHGWSVVMESSSEVYPVGFGSSRFHPARRRATCFRRAPSASVRTASGPLLACRASLRRSRSRWWEMVCCDTSAAASSTSTTASTASVWAAFNANWRVACGFAPTSSSCRSRCGSRFLIRAETRLRSRSSAGLSRPDISSAIRVR